jgi:cytochrome o ubiquinol oxidase subunit IV
MAFGLVWQGVPNPLPILVTLAILQLVVQLMLFLHLGDEPKPRWNLLAFLFAVLVVAIVVGGTLWIMYELSHPPGDASTQKLEEYNVFEEENIFPYEIIH